MSMYHSFPLIGTRIYYPNINTSFDGTRLLLYTWQGIRNLKDVPFLQFVSETWKKIVSLKFATSFLLFDGRMVNEVLNEELLLVMMFE